MRRIRSGQKPIAGTRLIREWQGAEHAVTVRDDGYEYRGAPYKSLSSIARAITGTRWNGWVFFGLKNTRAGARKGTPVSRAAPAPNRMDRADEAGSIPRVGGGNFVKCIIPKKNSTREPERVGAFRSASALVSSGKEPSGPTGSHEYPGQAQQTAS